MKTNAQTINYDFFASREKNYSNELSSNEEPAFGNNIAAGLLILFSVFSLFVLFFASVLFSLGIQNGLIPIVVTIMLSAAAGITTFILSYASAVTFE